MMIIFFFSLCRARGKKRIINSTPILWMRMDFFISLSQFLHLFGMIFQSILFTWILIRFARKMNVNLFVLFGHREESLIDRLDVMFSFQIPLWCVFLLLLVFLRVWSVIKIVIDKEKSTLRIWIFEIGSWLLNIFRE